jgi:hypothetical protein
MEFFLQVEQAMRRLPGVLTVGMSDSLPPGGTHDSQIFSNIAVGGKPRPTGGMVAWRWVTPEYFTSLDIPILRGRPFTAQQRTSNESFLILSSLLASHLFGTEDPIGKQVQPVPDGPWYTVLGIAANIKNAGLAADDEPEYYRLRRDLAEDWTSDAVLEVKTTLRPESLAPWIRAQIAQIDPTVPVDIDTLAEHVSKLADRPRFETALLGVLRFLRPADGGDWALWRDCVRGCAAHAGDWGAHGAGRDAAGHSKADCSRGCEADRAGRSHGPGRCFGCGATVEEPAL